MSSPNYVPPHSPTAFSLVNLVAETATETPQILLTWQEVEDAHSSIRIVRRRQHTPSHADDGVVVYQALRVGDATSFADTVLLHEETYYYALFYELNGYWILPEQGATAYAFSGSKPWLVEKEQTSGGYTAAVTGVLDAYFTPNDTRINSVSLSAKVKPGDWLLVGGGLRAVVARVISVSAPYVYTEIKQSEFEADADRVPERVSNAGLSIKRNNPAYGNTCTISRSTGSFKDDGYVAGYPVMVTGTRNALNPPWKVHTVLSVYDTVMTFAPGEMSTESSGAISIETPRWRLPGEVVRVMRSAGPFLVRKFYQEYLPDNAIADDADVGQTYSLTETTLTSGEKVNIGSPGEQYGLERFTRALVMELAKAHGAANYRVDMRDLQQAPVAYVRKFAGNYAFEIPEGIRQDFLARAFSTVQPYLASYRGRTDNIRTWLRVITGQSPAQVVYGRDRVLRFGDTNAGFAQDGTCKVLAIPTATSFTVDTAVWGLVPSRLVGGKVYKVTSFTAGTYTLLGTITNVIGGSEVVVNGSTASLSANDDVLLSPVLPSVSGPAAYTVGMYDPAVVNGKGSFFNDRGVAYYLTGPISEEESDILRGYLEDTVPMTVSALVFAALEVAVNLL